MTNINDTIDKVVMRGDRILNKDQDGLQIIDDDAIAAGASSSPHSSPSTATSSRATPRPGSG